MEITTEEYALTAAPAGLIQVVELHPQIFDHTAMGAKHCDTYAEDEEKQENKKETAVVSQVLEVRHKAFK